MSSSRTKKVHYERPARGTNGRRNRSRDSGIGSRDSGIDNSSISDRTSMGTGPDSSFPFEDSTSISALREALDSANEKIRQLEASHAALNQLLADSNRENRLIKREKAELHNQLDDAMDKLEDEKRSNRRERVRPLDESRERYSSVASRSNGPLVIVDDRRSSLKPPPREERISSAKSIDLAIISQPTRFFQIGRVFKTLWTEPAGETATDTDKEYYRPVGYGQLSFTKMRRFVVVRKRLHSCLCLAISTYGGQGAAKKDSRSGDHAVVYSSKDPVPLDDQFTKEPIPIIIEESSETIDPKSVIDFGRVYTVEHNVKVLNVGRLAKVDKKRLDQYFTDTIGASADLDDETYGSDVPAPRPDIVNTTPARRTLGRRSSYTEVAHPSMVSAPPPNPMANPFTPRSTVTYAPAAYTPSIMYAPLPTSYGHFSPPRPPDGPSKFPLNDGNYHPYPL